MSYADIKTKDGFFWCRSHAEELPLSQRSLENPKYCNDCWATIKSEMPVKISRIAEDTTDDVTALTPTRTIIDSFLKEALAKNNPESTRAIAAGLKDKGIVISHMTVHRKLRELKSTGALL